jgi:hypothetical protein
MRPSTHEHFTGHQVKAAAVDVGVGETVLDELVPRASN